ncbi:MAG: hypothetical protein LBF37_00805, partial [Rickettsiales bacterium]|nr:hypothetical protein [Rickettsiales bacterium]
MKLSKFDFSVLKLQPMLAIWVGVLCVSSVNAAEVVQRGTTARPTISRANTSASRMPALQAKAVVAAVTAEEEVKTETAEPEVEEVVEEVTIIENKSSQFDKILNNTGTSAIDTAADARAAAIRAQRAALDSADATSTANQKMEAALADLNNACDSGLRNCMKQTCGNDFSKCAGDGDTILGNKFDKCRRDTTCSGSEFQMCARAINADRDFNRKLGS